MIHLREVLPVVICLILINTGLAQTRFLQGDWEDIMKKARDENKPVFVDLYFTGCMPCAQMDKRVFPDEKVAALLNNDFITCKVNVFHDQEKALGEKLMKKYAITGFPTLLLLSPDQHVINIQGGFAGVDKLVGLLKDAKRKNESREYKKYSTSFDMEFPDFYNAYFESKKLTATPDDIEAYLDARDDKMAEVPFLIMMKLVNRGKYADYYIRNSRKLGDMYGKERVAMSLLDKIREKADKLGKDNDIEGYDTVLEDIRKMFDKGDWNRLSIGSFYTPYYKASGNTFWFIKKVEEGAYDWQERSNAYAQVIIDSRNNKQALSTLASLYKKNRTDHSTAADIYKMGLIQFYLGKHDEATETLQHISGAKTSYYLNEEDITALQRAIASGDTASFQPKAALDPKPMILE
ncbi:thioredoxin family protein [Sinomicrobium soli]|uniref:thioredoxin family protein n=1 Tax=Sinomicrobium sp. N-1-3-6 TaxID=2219864 RepID=UPI000DCC41FD|nr:DUF255 domain-containing protein [Sinomicrobium sp. N-1-3-6]RAV28941.1 hypothetical protein DN748_11150 [Sinomicrobium sp. N-1-3-6]